MDTGLGRYVADDFREKHEVISIEFFGILTWLYLIQEGH